MVAPTHSRIVKFGLFEVDLEAGEVRKSGIRQKLAGQPFQVLQLLLEHPREIVSRDELRRRIWTQNTYVDYDLGLRRAITRVREVLGDSAESPRFIETVPRRGYRFIAPLNTNGDAPVIPEVPTAGAPLPSQSLRGMLIGIVLAFGLAAGLAAIVVFKTVNLKSRESAASAMPQVRSLAVLPLQNLSADPADEYFTEGMTDALITALAQNSSLKVISRTSSMKYQGTKKSLPEIARELNVDGIVEGTVQRSGDRVRITAQLIDGSSDKHLWANSYERDKNDIFALESNLADDIAQHVQANTTPSPHSEPRVVDSQALEAYLKGKYHEHKFSRGYGDEELTLASNYFQQAIDADPNFALAYVGQSDCRNWTMQSSKEDADLARNSAERAVELDPSLSDAWHVLGEIRWNFWDWTGAEESYRRAIQLNPNNVDAHYHLGMLLDSTGRLDDGWREAQIAQQLDPNQDRIEFALYVRAQYDRAIGLLATQLGNDPNSGYYHHKLFENYAAKGMAKEAIEQLEQAATLFGYPEIAIKLRHAFATSGYDGAMRKWAKQLENLYASKRIFLPVNVAAAYATIGDKDRAFYWLEEGYRQRGRHTAGVQIGMITVYRGLDPLRSDPRFQDLLRRMRLPR